MHTEYIYRHCQPKYFVLPPGKLPNYDSFRKNEKARGRQLLISPHPGHSLGATLWKGNRDSASALSLNSWHRKDFQERYTELSSGRKVSTHLRMQSITGRGNRWRQEIHLSVYLWSADPRVAGGFSKLDSPCLLPGDPALLPKNYGVSFVSAR